MKNPYLKTILTLITITAALSCRSQAQSFLTNGLAAYYPMSGNANDASGNGNNGTVYGATLTTNRFGVAQSAYDFNGSAKILASASALPGGNSNRTVSAWFLERGVNQDIVTMGNSAVTGARFSMLYGYSSNPNTISFVGSGNDYVVNLGKSLMDSRWHHFVITYNNDTNTGSGVLYLDGTQIGSFLKPTLNTDNTFPLVLGSNSTNINNEYLNGQIDDVRIYNRTLSATEVTNLFQFESTASPVVSLKNAVYLNSANLVPGVNYQVQVSPDLSTWTNSGVPFTAVSNVWNSPNYWPLANPNQLYFRVQVAP